MSVVRSSLAFAPVLALLALPAIHAGPAPSDRSKDDAANDATEIEVRCIDDSVLKLKLLDEKLELVTKHGTLRIAVADIRRIEFATRVPPDVTEKVAVAVARLGHPDSQARDRATSALRAFRERAYPALQNAAKGTDAEVVRRAEAILKFIKQTVPAANLELREFDVIYTDDSKIAGKLATASLRVRTAQFGEQALKLSDVRSVGPPPAARNLDPAIPAPQNLMAYQNQVGKELTFTVTGVAGGSVWGSDVYTLDSTFAAAAVHAGQVQIGQTANVQVRIVPSPQQFQGVTRNGILSAPYGVFPAAFEFIEK